MRVDILSDLHVTSPDDRAYPALIEYLSISRNKNDVIVFGGDLFDVWIGSKKSFQSRYPSFFNKIFELDQRGIQVHFIQGNHDFGFGGLFKKYSNVHIHDRQIEIIANSTPNSTESTNFKLHADQPAHSISAKILIDHGDLIQNDFGYRCLRILFRSCLFRFSVFLAPQSWIDFIGNKMSRYSESQHPNLPETWEAKKLNQLRETFRNFAEVKWSEGYNSVVLGHCHDLDSFEKNDLKGNKLQYFNMGFPKVHGSFIRWESETGTLRREKLNLNHLS